MGATTFFTVAKGKTAKEAFSDAVYEARYQHGHGGYTGTIAEKSRFVMITLPEGENPVEYADRLIDMDDPRISDKWGDAGCIPMGDDKYLFFGWASE
jgi:hypothetical protein